MMLNDCCISKSLSCSVALYTVLYCIYPHFDYTHKVAKHKCIVSICVAIIISLQGAVAQVHCVAIMISLQGAV